MDFGHVFLMELAKSRLSPDVRIDIKQRARAFLVDIFKGLQLRLKGSLSLFKKLEVFVTSTFQTTLLTPLNFPPPFFPQDPKLLSEIELIAKKIQILKLKDMNVVSFWMNVHNFKYPLGEYSFQPFTNCIVKILCLPISNAEVERVFSQITLLKNSLRSQMKLDLLEAILNCKFGLSE